MLKSWSIENFKPIVNSGELKLAPVTILAGRNSSGKSSLLQSILMIAQTLSNQVPDRALLPNERIVQLGTFEDILSEFSGSRSMTFKFEINYDREEIRQSLIDLYRISNLSLSNHKVAVTFGSASSNAGSSAIEASKVVVEGVSLEFIFEYPIPFIEKSSFKEAEHETTTFKGVFFAKQILDDELKQLWENVAIDYPPFVPYIEKYNYLGEFKFTSDKEDTDRTVSEQFLVALSHFLPTNLVRQTEKHSEESERNYFGEVNFEEAVGQIKYFFTSKVRYLGPLRADPGITQQQFAPTSELDDVGFKGEYAAVVYHYNQLAQIDWYNPQTTQVEQGTLQDALDTWARYLDVATQVRTEIAGSMGVAWKVVLKEGQKARTLPEVGVGVSQVLPILVMGLLAPANTLLIIEQPELHLHASVQARLGDFFVGLSKCKKQCLIETHSENLVSQLRYHIVQSGGQDKSDCMIYFVDQDEKGATRFEPVEISPQGNILNWPDGFFDETMLQEDRITAASIKRRANKVKNG